MDENNNLESKKTKLADFAIVCASCNLQVDDLFYSMRHQGLGADFLRELAARATVVENPDGSTVRISRYLICCTKCIRAAKRAARKRGDQPGSAAAQKELADARASQWRANQLQRKEEERREWDEAVRVIDEASRTMTALAETTAENAARFHTELQDLVQIAEDVTR